MQQSHIRIKLTCVINTSLTVFHTYLYSGNPLVADTDIPVKSEAVTIYIYIV